MAGTIPSPQSVIVSFKLIHDALEDIITYTPYVPEHEGVWSARLANVIFEACSQFDSLLEVRLRPPTSTGDERWTIADYFERRGVRLAPKWLVFWAETPMRLHPFEEWQTATQFDKKSYKNTPLPWWDAYNALKHRRYDNLRQATLKNAVLALAGLFIEMVATEQLAQALISTGWFSANNNNPAVCWDDELNSIQHNSICGETSLFAYPVGMWRTALRQNHGGWWSGNASFRFKTWYVDAHFPKSPVHPSHPRP